MARLVSAIWWWRCSATLYLLMTRPSATPISSAPVSRPARRGRLPGSAGSRSRSEGPRVCGRVRSPIAGCAGDQPLAGVVGVGDLGQAWVSNRLICSGPSSRASWRSRGAQRGDPPDVASSSTSPGAAMRADAIMPRSPTITIRRSPNVSRTTVSASTKAVDWWCRRETPAPPPAAPRYR